MTDTRFWDILRLTTKKAQPIDKLCLRLGLSERELTKLAKEANSEGFRIRVQDGMVTSRSPSIGPTKPVILPDPKPGRHSVAIVTDTHFGSSHTDLVGLEKFLAMAWGRGIRHIICTGDILDGNKDVLLHDQNLVGFDHQSDLAVEVVSGAKPFKWIAIDGNHDGYYSASSGMVSGVQLGAKMREAGVDWSFAGVCLGRARVLGANWQLWHPHGGAGTRNAIRRILNSRIESLEEPCDVLAIGHFHKYATVQAYPENVFGVAGGTFQKKRSEFANRISNGWDIGASIVSWTFRKDGSAAEFSAEFFPTSQGNV